MVCLYCGSFTDVINSRPQKRQNSVWRRRRCKSCSAIVTSSEAIDLSKSLVVARSSGAFSAFQRDRLFIDVYDAVRHRKTALSDASSLTDTIISKSLTHVAQGSIDRQTIINITQQTLAAFDHAAATHYDAFHG